MRHWGNLGNKFSFQGFFITGFQFAFPDGDHIPSHEGKFSLYHRVTYLIPFQFLLPKSSIGFRNRGTFTAGVLVPKTTVHEDGGTILGQDDIRCPREIAPIKPETKPHMMKEGAKPLFGFGVPTSYVGHYPTAFFLRETIHFTAPDEFKELFSKRILTWCSRQCPVEKQIRILCNSSELIQGASSRLTVTW